MLEDYTTYRKQASEELNIPINTEPPGKMYKYVTLKNGETKEFFEEKDARNYSKIYEKIVTNQDIVDEYWAGQRQIEVLASDRFHTDLRAMYSYIHEDIYTKIYSMAYDDGHSSGYDEVASYVMKYAEFAEDIIKIVKHLVNEVK